MKNNSVGESGNWDFASLSVWNLETYERLVSVDDIQYGFASAFSLNQRILDYATQDHRLRVLYLESYQTEAFLNEYRCHVHFAAISAIKAARQRRPTKVATRFLGNPFSEIRTLCDHYPRIAEFIPLQGRHVQKHRNNSNAFANTTLKRHECRAPLAKFLGSPLSKKITIFVTMNLLLVGMCCRTAFMSRRRGNATLPDIVTRFMGNGGNGLFRFCTAEGASTDSKRKNDFHFFGKRCKNEPHVIQIPRTRPILA